MVWIMGLAAIVAGLFVLWVAIPDRWGVFSSWYEENKDSHVGFWAISTDARHFRFWFIVLGVAVTGAGIAALAVAA